MDKTYKMKFHGFMFLKAWDWIFIIPTIEIIRDELQFGCGNFSIIIHFLGWHWRWRWVEERFYD